MKIIIDKNPRMEKTFEQLDELSRDKKLREEYEHRLMEETAYKTDLDENYRRGKEEGREEGKEEEREKKDHEFVLNMLKNGFDLSAIKLATGLSEGKINSIIAGDR
jgi:predicted transposase/invertase (TIGR01784 family)